MLSTATAWQKALSPLSSVVMNPEFPVFYPFSRNRPCFLCTSILWLTPSLRGIKPAGARRRGARLRRGGGRQRACAEPRGGGTAGGARQPALGDILLMI